MSFRNTIIVLILLVIVGGLALYVQHQPEEETVKLFPQLKPEDITKIILQYPDHMIEVERTTGDKWMITMPVKTDADQTTADNLARAIADCEVKKTVEEKPGDLAPFGLAKPDVTVTITTKKKGQLPGIQVGKTTPIGFSAYIKTTDKPAVMLTASAFPPGMKKQVSDLRDRELMDFKVDDARRITIEREGSPTVELVKDKGDTWKIDQPAAYTADSTQVRVLLSALANARVADFTDDFPNNVARYGLEKPRLTVSVYTGDKGNSQHSLEFGLKEPEQGKDGIYVRRGERAGVYTVHEYVMNDVDKTTLDLRDKTVLGFEPSNVDKATIRGDGGEYALERGAGGKWQIDRGGSKSDADVTLVERFLDQVRDLKGLKIVEDPVSDLKKFGMDKPTVEITLVGKDGKRIGAMELARVERRNEGEPTPTPAPGEPALPAVQRTDYYAMSSAGKALFSIDDFGFGQLDRTAEQFRARNTPAPSPTPAK